MSWFKREDGEYESGPPDPDESVDAAGKNGAHRRPVDQVPGLPRGPLQGRTSKPT